MSQCQIIKRIEFLIFLTKEKDDFVKNELQKIFKDMKLVKSMRDYVSHCSVHEDDKNNIFFEKSNILDFDKADLFIGGKLERICEELKDVDFSNNNERDIAIARKIMELAPKKNMSDLNDAIEKARNINKFIISFHKSTMSAT